MVYVGYNRKNCLIASLAVIPTLKIVAPPMLETPAFNRDPASIRTPALSPLCLLMSFVPMFPVYVNFTLHVNSQHLLQ